MPNSKTRLIDEWAVFGHNESIEWKHKLTQITSWCNHLCILHESNLEMTNCKLLSHTEDVTRINLETQLLKNEEVLQIIRRVQRYGDEEKVHTVRSEVHVRQI